MIYDVDYFISKFQAIPENKWMVGDYRDEAGNFCAYGHCGVKSEYDGFSKYPEAKALYRLGLAHKKVMNEINDGLDDAYLEATPKQRILAALHDIKNKLSNGQEVQEGDATKTSKEVEAGPKIIHHYHKVTVPESIETKELFLS